MPPRLPLLALLAGLALATPAQAGQEMRAGGKLVLTDGVSSVEGAAGGGLATWALIGGNETRDGIGGSAHVTYVPLADYSLTSYGAAIGIMDRVELSYTRQVFDTHEVGAALGLGKGFTFDQDVLGAKLRLLGDAVYDQDSWLPQVSVGAQYKHANRGTIIHAVGGAHDSGTDFFVSATKILLGQSLVLDGTVRATKANQFGLLGFGGDRHDSYSAQFEGSAAVLLTRKLAVGGEARTKPDNLGFAREDAAWDAFAAYAVTKNVSLTAAYVDLGSIATVKGQRGAFLSLQTSF
ncbi:DUF3034 family protein [Sphingomonas sp. CGMCC 1.13654]|uniref:DUF3034 family protein n=1 Tax=Sphingomonas chungangi TaxID=2683589 RepID=A0A838L5B5_9SPHN|nr:DUF3034 family protein [Sphingomonas chungangi]MBA2934100.1 DUF3034 family protein [Sphingomonas chungangi]MVW57141.1 DUF3034 family protein [Sphingomonas chungangi]